MFRSYGDYTTNLPLKDVLTNRPGSHSNLMVQILPPNTAARATSGPSPLFLEERQMGEGLTLMPHDKPGFWEGLGYHIYGDPWLEQRYSASDVA